MKRLLIPAAVAAALALAAPASAHTPAANPGCDGLAVNATQYNDAHVLVVVDGQTVANRDFHGAYTHTFAWSDTTAHTWAVTITASDWPTYSPNGTQQPCHPTTTTTVRATTTTSTTPPPSSTTTSTPRPTTTELSTTTTSQPAGSTSSSTPPAASTTPPTSAPPAESTTSTPAPIAPTPPSTTSPAAVTAPAPSTTPPTTTPTTATATTVATPDSLPVTGSAHDIAWGAAVFVGAGVGLRRLARRPKGRRS